MWWRRLAEVQTQHQNGEERGFKWLWMWNGCWCQTRWAEYFKNCRSTGIFMHNHLYGLQRMVWKREYIQWAAVVWTKMPCWCQRRMGRVVRDDKKATVTRITTRYNQGMQNIISEHTTRRILKQMGYSSRRPHRVPLLSAKNRKQRLQLTQALMSLDFCCEIQMVGSEFGVKNIKVCIHLAFYQRFRLVVVV